MPNFFQGPGAMPNQPYVPGPPQYLKHGKGGKHQDRPRKGDKAPFSADGPVFDKSKSTIVVENVPEENFTEEQVRNFFSQFGTILEVTMKPYKRLAIVKYDSWDAANAAYQSPKVIFDNRFVKVFWYKDEATSASAPKGKAAGGKAQGTNGTTAEGSGASSHGGIDLEEFTKRQLEKQKEFEEKQRKKQELERQREELERRQKELLAKQAEEKAKLEAKLAAANGSKSSSTNDDSSQKKPLSEALRDQLAALEAEARQMGLDPDALDTATPSPSWSARGGGYGRGRGGWRGTSSPYYAPRGRGSYRGRANLHAAYAAYSLDNRPKKVLLTGADFTVSEKDEKLRQYLFVSLPGVLFISRC